ncbi:MAG: hypothetical protein WCT20_00825 [Candidatus Babeliales bacterium]|jgi:uncharacterized membrane protein
MASLISTRERAWALVVHAPIITIIWVGYIVFKLLNSSRPFLTVIAEHVTSLNSLPITPLLFTLMTIPISLFVYRVQRRSQFVKTHATQAYLFNVSLMRWYGCCLVTVLAGQFLHIPMLAKAGFFLLSCASINCFIQATFGMRAAITGKPFKYYFVSMLFSR